MSVEPIRCAVAFSICKALFRDLSGFRGYPKEEPGEDHFIRTFQRAVISVDHARAVVESFTGTMPTIQEIRDSALNLRAQFEPSEDLKAKWQAEGATYGPVEVPTLTGSDRHLEMWKQIFKKIPDRTKIKRMSWTQLAAVVREIGGYDDYANAWERSGRHGG
jgi:hypothetical protein